MIPSRGRSSRLRVFEVGPRDGLQNEPNVLAVEKRLEFVMRLAEAGLADIEIGALVRRDWIPAMEGTDDLIRALPRLPGVRFWGLVPNLKGLERAFAAGLGAVSIVASASETHSRKNLNRPIGAVMQENRALAREAAGAGAPVRAYISVAFGCPYEGKVAWSRVLDLAREFFDMGIQEVAFSDTTGMAHPDQLRAAAAAAFAAADPRTIAFHFHDTGGLGLVNALAVIEEGAQCLDGSTGGIGGCPYAPGAAGNLATEELVHLLDVLGIESGVDLEKLVRAVATVETAGIPVFSRYYRRAKANRSKPVTS